MIRVCLIEDQTLVREGLETLLQLTTDIQVVATARTGREGLSILADHKPDVVLLDVRMPEMSGLQVLEAIAASAVEQRVIILTTFDDDAVILESCRLGAKGFLLKDISLSMLTEAIRTVAAGGTMFSPIMTERLLRAIRSSRVTDESNPERLTDRELEILRLMTGGFSNGEIGFALKVAEGTVKNHVSNILNKLDVRDRVRAVLKAIEMGYLSGV